MDDHEIIGNVLSGNTNAFGELVIKYQAKIHSLCMGFVHDREEAGDLTQDIFLKAYESLQAYRHEASFSTWLYRIAVNLLLNRQRTINRRGILRRIEYYFSMGHEPRHTRDFLFEFDPEKIVISDETRSAITNALDSLPGKQKTAFVLSKYDELSQKEIAAIMHTTEGAVEALLQRAKAGLQKRLRNYRYLS